MRELRGNLHVHSTESDGTLSLPEIALAAAGCKLDFVGINDHYAACTDNMYMDGVLFLMGTEYNTAHSHYLAYNAGASTLARQEDGARVIQDVREKGGMGIIAHPFETGSPLVGRGKSYPWQDWNVRGYDGIELWNQTSQWRDAVESIPQALWLWFFRRYCPFFRGACPRSLEMWDQICQSGHVTGLAGSDLHAPLFGWKKMGLKVLDYTMLFSLVNNYVLVNKPSGDARRDSHSLIESLKSGCCWFALDWLDLAYGFSFTASNGERQASMGETLELAEGLTWLRIVLPRGGEITIIQNGRSVLHREAAGLDFPVPAPGVYRVEVRLKRRRRWIPWIYSNPLYIK